MKTEEWYDFINEEIVKTLKEAIDCQDDPTFDPFETPDNKAQLVSSLYEVLKYCSMPDEYQAYVKGKLLNARP